MSALLIALAQDPFELLGSDDVRIRDETLLELRKTASDLLPQLRLLLRHPDPEVAGRARDLLFDPPAPGGIQVTRCPDPLGFWFCRMTRLRLITLWGAAHDLRNRLPSAEQRMTERNYAAAAREYAACESAAWQGFRITGLFVASPVSLAAARLRASLLEGLAEAQRIPWRRAE